MENDEWKQIFTSENAAYNDYKVDYAISKYANGLFDSSVHLSGDMKFTADLSVIEAYGPINRYVNVTISENFAKTLPMVHPSATGFNVTIGGGEIYDELYKLAENKENVTLTASGVRVSYEENWGGDGGNVLTFDNLTLASE